MSDSSSVTVIEPPVSRTNWPLPANATRSRNDAAAGSPFVFTKTVDTRLSPAAVNDSASEIA